MSRFSPFEVPAGDRVKFKEATFPMGTVTSNWNFEFVTFKRGIMPLVFRDTRFRNTVFDNVNLEFAVFIDCEFHHCTFRRCAMRHVSFVGCTGSDLAFRGCELDRSMLYGLMVDGLTFARCGLAEVGISVKSEYLAPIKIRQCNFDKTTLLNTATEQYESPFGLPVAGTNDRASVRMDSNRGDCRVMNFAHA